MDGNLDTNLQMMGLAAEVLADLERKRKMALGLAGLCLAAVFAAGALLFMMAGGEIMGNWGLQLTFLVCFAWFFYLAPRPARAWYAKAYRRLLGPALVQELDGSLSYDPDGFVPKERFVESSLFREQTGKLTGAHRVSGMRGVPFQFSEVIAWRRQTFRVGTKQRDRWEDFFRGVFYVADLERSFRGTTFLTTSFGGRSAQKTRDFYTPTIANAEPVVFDDPVFQEDLVVISTDPDEAREILTPERRSALVEFCREMGRIVRFSFRGRSFYAAVALERPAAGDGSAAKPRFGQVLVHQGLLEPRLLAPAYDRKAVDSFMRDVRCLAQLAERLDLPRLA